MSVSIPDVDADAPDRSEADRLIRRFIESKREETDTPHRDADVLMHFYWDMEMSQKDVADELACNQRTVSKWLDKTDLGARDEGEMGRQATRVKRAKFGTHHSDGHERWTARDPDGTIPTVGVHQLLAVADGADPHVVWADDTHVHHRTGVPWLNMPGMVEVLTPGEHKRTHTTDEWTEDGGIPVLETQD